jgi:3-hydroxyisobutyrate dehydrogenase
VVKILNNMLVFQHCGALAEAIAIGRRNGVPADVLLPTIAMGSGDSFVLRNHGVKAMLPDIFPERAFSVRYAMKDLSYALEMAAASGLDVAAAELTMARLKRTVESGYGEQYHPVVLKVIDPQ